jgi:molecular chaperone HscB
MATDPFATLGFAHQYAIDKSALDRRYRELQQALHPDRHASAPASARALTLHKAVAVNEAYRVLRDDLKRGEALLQVLGGHVTEHSADPELLMEMMELRGALTEARAVTDAVEVARLAGVVAKNADGARSELAAAFMQLQSVGTGAGVDSAKSGALLAHAQQLLGRLRYYHRFQEEVARFEDEALA